VFEEGGNGGVSSCNSLISSARSSNSDSFRFSDVDEDEDEDNEEILDCGFGDALGGE
jgi:hypothetical protein